MSDSVQYLRGLFDHMEWANERAIEAVRQVDDPRALALLAHALASDVVWYARIETGQSSHLQIWPTLSIDECADLARESVRGYRKLMDGLTPDDLERRVAYRNSKGTEFQTRLGDILLHVVLHGSYHRGQIALRLRESGGEPVNTDYITWVREREGEAGGS